MPNPLYPGTLPGAPAFGYSGAYGGIPPMPNPIATAGGAAAGNLGNLQGIQGLSGATNQFNTQQQLAQLEQMIPGYTSATAKSTDNILQELSGQVPSDVVNQIIQSAAERGVMTGGGPNANAAYLRALGLTSLGMQQQGQQNLSAAVARTPRPGLLDPASFFVGPGQQQEAQYGANVLGAAPVPSQAAEEARRNALAGLGAGRASVPGAPGFQMPNLPSNFGGYGGTSFGVGLGISSSGTPSAAYDAWNQWMSGIPTGGGQYGSPIGPQDPGQYGQPIGPQLPGQYDQPIGPQDPGQYGSPIGPNIPGQYGSPIGPQQQFGSAYPGFPGGLSPFGGSNPFGGLNPGVGGGDMTYGGYGSGGGFLPYRQGGGVGTDWPGGPGTNFPGGLQDLINQINLPPSLTDPFTNSGFFGYPTASPDLNQ